MAQQTKLTIEPKAWKTMAKSAMRTYPNECCGFFFGNTAYANSTVVHAVNVNNTSSSNKRSHFEISAKSYMDAEQYAYENKLLLLGVYHSHPDSTALPSATDLKLALPNFSYLIIAVGQKQLNEAKCWQLDENYSFKEQYVKIIT